MEKLVATIPKSARDEIAVPLIADDTQTMPQQNPPSPSAIRMRRCRERHDRGAVVISLEVDRFTLDALVDHGFLSEADLKSRAKVHEAVDLLLFALSDDAIEIDWEKYE